MENVEQKEKKYSFKLSLKKIILYSTVALISVIVIAVIFVVPSIKYKSFENAYDSGDYIKAVHIYEQFFDSPKALGYVENYAINKLNSKFDEYYNGKISSDELKLYVDGVSMYFKFPEFLKYTDKLNSVLSSANSYNIGVQAENEKRYADAIDSYRNVNEMDPNYLNANSKLPNIENEYKKYIEESLIKWKADNDYKNALWEIANAQRIFGNEAYVKEWAEFDAIKQSSEKTYYEGHQSVYSYNERVSHDGNGNTALAVAQVQNNSDKTVKEYVIVFCGYDSSGSRVKLASVSAPGEISDYIKCRNKSADIASGSNTGSTFGWGISEETSKSISKIESCIVSVVYSDGTSWNNPYYSYWCSDRGIVDYA